MIGGPAREAVKQPTIRMKRPRVKAKNWRAKAPSPPGSAALVCIDQLSTFVFDGRNGYISYT